MSDNPNWQPNSDHVPPDVAERIAEVVALRESRQRIEAVLQRIVVDTVIEQALDSRTAGHLFGVSHMTIQRWVNKRHPGYMMHGGAR